MEDFGGAGPGILLLHGLMGRARTWAPVAAWLTGHGHVFGLDARGHGDSPHPGSGAVTEDFVADAAQAARELGIAPATVVGHSMGGLHGLCLAATHPDLVRAVVVEDFAPDQRGRSVDGWREHFATWPMPFDSLDDVRRYFGRLGDYFAECFTGYADGYRLTADLEELYEIAGEWGRRDYWPIVRRVRCPVLVIEPEHSAMPPGQLRELAETLPRGQYVHVPDAGHVVHYDQPAAYRSAVERFLSGLQQ
jgi:pimeloyl-ACP methyl ester carboxylesterase